MAKTSLSHLDLPAPEEGVVERHGRADRVLVRELDVGEPLGVDAQMTSTQKGGPETLQIQVQTALIGYCDNLGTRPKNSRRPIIVTGR